MNTVNHQHILRALDHPDISTAFHYLSDAISFDFVVDREQADDIIFELLYYKVHNRNRSSDRLASQLEKLADPEVFRKVEFLRLSRPFSGDVTRRVIGQLGPLLEDKVGKGQGDGLQE